MSKLGDESSRNKDTDTDRQHERDDIDTRLFGRVISATLVVEGKLVPKTRSASLHQRSRRKRTYVPPSMAHIRQNMKIEAPIWVRFLRIDMGMRAFLSMYHSQNPKTGTRRAPRMKRRMIRQSTSISFVQDEEARLTGPLVVVTTPLEGE
jgi:hypothetical protein